ncbi:hypothetical protein TCON_2112 [Astathelohania contejeani]|uniref:Uncharacterized protein n=1 Tax=Astathelohania contejeani TaxID=164912 RepID=A0ABQ7HWX2_9MICR|nr:hypothetical protein TCON_2112 [Thelohania contejeani]
MENCLLLAFNYIQKTFYESENNKKVDNYGYHYSYKKHILYEASISIVNMAKGFRYIDKSAFHFPLNNIYECLNINTKNENMQMTLDTEDDLNQCIQTLISKYNIKYVWVYGVNQILFELPALQHLTVFNIRNTTIHKFGDEIDLNESYCIPQVTFSIQQRHNKLPPVLKSITNICQMLAKNLLRGYQDSTKTMTFYTTNNSNPDTKDLQCFLHLEDSNNFSNSTCACLLNEINRLTLMFISASQDLYITEYKEYLNTHDVNELTCQYMAEREVEYKLQAILLSMIWPEKINWKCIRNEDEVQVNIQIINKHDQSNPLTNQHKWIQWEVSNFSKHINKNTRVNHQTSSFITNILLFLGYDLMYNIHSLP